MGKPWNRTPEQTVYLKSQFHAYRLARKESRLEAFRAKLTEGWFDRWPEREVVFPDWKEGGPPLTKEQMSALGVAMHKRQKQLYDYVRWHSVAKPVRSRNPRTLLSRYLRSMRKARSNVKQGHRKRTILKVYSDLYYKSKLQDKIMAEVHATAPTAETPRQRTSHQLRVYQKLRAESWASESDEVKAEVQKIYDKETGNEGDSDNGDNDDSDSDEDDTEVSEEKLLERQQECIDIIGDVITSFLKDASEATGWAFCVLGGGLDKKGDLKIANSFIGKTPAGSTFQQTHKGWQEEVVLPWFNFLRLRHSVEERLRHANLWMTESANTLSAGLAGTPPTGDVAAQRENVDNGPTSIISNDGSNSSVSATRVAPVTEGLNAVTHTHPEPGPDHVINPDSMATPSTPPTLMPQLPATVDLTPMSKFIATTDPLYTWNSDDWYNTAPTLPVLPSADPFDFSGTSNWNFHSATSQPLGASINPMADPELASTTQAFPIPQSDVAANVLQYAPLSAQQITGSRELAGVAAVPSSVHGASAMPLVTNSTALPTAEAANVAMSPAVNVPMSSTAAPTVPTFAMASSPASATIISATSAPATNTLTLPMANAASITLTETFTGPVPMTMDPPSITLTESLGPSVGDSSQDSTTDNMSNLAPTDAQPGEKSKSKKRKTHKEECAHLMLPDGTRRTRKPRTDENNASTALGRGRKSAT